MFLSDSRIEEIRATRSGEIADPMKLHRLHVILRQPLPPRSE
jgi:hypothetical protein